MTQSIDSLMALTKMTNNAEVIHGLDGYTKAMLLRMESKSKVVKQIINAEKVVPFHTAPLPDFIKQAINKRAALGITLKNLIRPQDVQFTIELSDPATLKETRVLPSTFETDMVMATFDDFVTCTSLDMENTLTIIVKDHSFAKTFDSIFETLWQNAAKV